MNAAGAKEQTSSALKGSSQKYRGEDDPNVKKSRVHGSQKKKFKVTKRYKDDVNPDQSNNEAADPIINGADLNNDSELKQINRLGLPTESRLERKKQ